MKNSILLIVLAFFLSMNITGCSLFSSGEEEAETATMADAGEASGGEEFASDEFETGDDVGDSFEADDFDAEAMASDEGEEKVEELAGNDVEVEDNFGDEYPDDDFGDSAGTAVSAAGSDDFSEDYIDDASFGGEDEVDDSFGDSDFGTDSLAMDEGASGLPTDTMSSNAEEDLFGQPDSMEPVVDTPTFADSSYDSGMSYDEPAGMSGLVSVKKMKPAAYQRAGGNVNRLYVVRPGENMDAVAEKIYGDSGQAEKLYSYNSHFRGKTLNVGDKVYYESPNNKNDPTMMTYYEDNNMSPSYYSSQEGDSIRKVAKKLLGHERSWMEIYATNENVESKGRLPAGLQLRYWPEGAATQTVAMNDTTDSTPKMDDPAPMPDPEPVAMDEPVDEPSFDEPADVPAMDEPTEMANLDEPDSLDDPIDEDVPPPAMGQVNNNPPPNQPVAPPPPPPTTPRNNMKKPTPPKMNAGNNAASDPMAAIGDDNMIMGALGGLLILAAIIMLIFIRRSRAKRVNFSQTQV